MRKRRRVKKSKGVLPFTPPVIHFITLCSFHSSFFNYKQGDNHKDPKGKYRPYKKNMMNDERI